VFSWGGLTGSLQVGAARERRRRRRKKRRRRRRGRRRRGGRRRKKCFKGLAEHLCKAWV
jgi:hypothetical protein